MTWFGSRKGAGIDELVERTLARARMAREPSAADKDRVLTALRDYVDDPTGAAPHEDGAASGVRQITQEAERYAAARTSNLSSAARGQGASPAPELASASLQKLGLQKLGLQKLALHKLTLQKLALQKLVWVGAFTGGVGFWLGSQPGPEPSATAAPAISAPARGAEAAQALPEPEPALAPALELPAAERPVPSVGFSAASPGTAPSFTPPPATEAATPAERPPSQRRPGERAPASVPPPEPATPEAASARPQPTARQRAAPASPARRDAASPAPASFDSASGSSFGSSSDSASGSAVESASASSFDAAPRSAAPSASANPASASTPAPSPGDASFLEAVRLIQRAQRSLERDAPHTALSLLDELDARYPAALLEEERLATRVLGFCAIGATARARRVAAELAAHNPTSIYAARIAQSCARPSASSRRR